MKYLYCKEVFSEVPGEITLALSISNCQIKCKGCNQKELWEDIGSILDSSVLKTLLQRHRGITCVLFMGSGNKEYQVLNSLAMEAHKNGLKVAVYLGEDNIPEELDKSYFDYIKIGHWDASKGGLDSPTTNQKMYFIEHQENGAYRKECINHKFLKNNED